MRYGYLAAFAGLFATAALIRAQEVSTTSNTKTPLLGTPIATQKPDLAVKSAAPPEALACLQTCPERPVRFWVSADYLLWWVKSGPTPGPIVTTSSSFNDVPPGGAGQPGTTVLFGDRPIGYGTFSGMRFGAGIDLGCGLSVEGSYFLLERRSSHFSVSSDANGSPLIGISTFNTFVGLEDALLTANPDAKRGIWAGTAEVSSHTRFQGWELNGASQSQRYNDWTFKALAGFRTLSLDEDFIVQNQFAPTIGGVLTFLGTPVPAGTMLTDFDHFQTGNRFYGGQVGARAEWKRDRLAAEFIGKVALGVTQETVTIDGASTATLPGAATVAAPGGIYAQVSNIGHYYHNAFAVVPEAGANLGYKITPNITAKVGYTFIYWSQVARPGEQIDRGVNQTLVPTHQFFNTNAPDGRPAFSFRETSFWAQGINFGVEFKF